VIPTPTETKALHFILATALEKSSIVPLLLSDIVLDEKLFANHSLFWPFMAYEQTKKIIPIPQPASLSFSRALMMCSLLI